MFLINYLYLTVDIPLYKRDTFIKALAAMPNSVLQSALDAKQADHECIALQLALTKAEIKSFKRHLAFLSMMHSQHVEAHTISEAHIDTYIGSNPRRSLYRNCYFQPGAKATAKG